MTLLTIGLGVACVLFVTWLAIVELRATRRRPAPRAILQHPSEPTEGIAARSVALAALQLDSTDIPWNDFGGTAITAEALLDARVTWGLTDARRWNEYFEQLMSAARFDPRVTQLFAERARLTAKARLSESHWARVAQGDRSTGGLDAHRIIHNVHRWEAEIARHDTARNIPGSWVVTSLRGYDLGEAAATAVWGVALGYVTREESALMLARVDLEARAVFSCWEDFGRSFIIGRCVVLSRSMAGDTAEADAEVVHLMRSYTVALDEHTAGPWTRLAW
ncbi:DUF1266 domain-containing protein [Glaciihabitans sp. dw_435]|uniref:DUF1266 domain-containing protein n=1 Tax=Glaciihabitans sp. dw_435 TaxID=2720081 RepID=UPI001BD34541|nr:DUF1266 domain-containing protein [Glaciihabitans sp. dw_435]